MASFNVANDGVKGLTESQLKVIVDAYKEVALSVDKLLGRDGEDWNLSVYNRAGGIGIQLKTLGMTVNRTILPDSGALYHEYFELSSKYQGKGINDHMAQASLKLVKEFGIKTVPIHANLDIGGYAWLRKGAWPHEGRVVLEFIAEEAKYYPELAEGFLAKIKTLNDTELKAYMFSTDFQKYKKVFLGSDWEGAFDVTDPVVRTAMEKGAKSAHKLSQSLVAKAPLTANDKIMDRFVRHQTYILRYAGGLRNRVLPTLAKSERNVYDTVVKWVTKAEGNRTLTGSSGRKWQADFEKALSGTRATAWADITEEVTTELRELAISEASVGVAMIEGSVPVVLGMTLPPASQLISIVNSQPFEGRTLKQWMEATEEADVQRMLKYAKTGIIQGQTPTEIARGIIGTKQTGYADGVARKAFHDIESVLLTLTNGIQNESKQALYEANADIIKDELYVATLDIGTTFVCAGNDGKTFKRGTGPIPPLHFRCRSLRVPYFGPDSFNNRPFNSGTEKQVLQEYAKKANISKVTSRADLPRGHKTKYDAFAQVRKRELVGAIPAKTNFNTFLGNQTEAFQNEYLGPTRADAFRRGDITLDKFVARDGDVLTLNELREKGMQID